MLDLSLYLVTDRSLSLNRELEWIVEEAAKGGITVVQLREKDCSTLDFIQLAQRLKQTLSNYNIPIIINDRIDVALAADADGVHIGQSDMPYKIARQLLGPNKIIGLSVENMAQVVEANELDVDYIGISPVFSTPTKTDTAPPFGLESLAEAINKSKHPSVAIGGINKANTPDIIKTNVGGIAVVSAICSAEQPQTAAQELKSIIQSTRELQ